MSNHFISELEILMKFGGIHSNLIFALIFFTIFFLVSRLPLFILILFKLRQNIFDIFVIFFPPIYRILTDKRKPPLSDNFAALETHHYNIAFFRKSRLKISHLQNLGYEARLGEESIGLVEILNFILHINMHIGECFVKFYYVFVVGIYDT